MAGIIVLPKVQKGTGKIVVTSIAADQIVGCEPCQISHGPKTYEGTKVYTSKGDYFKVLSNPVHMVQGWHLGKSDDKALVTMEPLTAIPSYSKATVAIAATSSAKA